MAGKGKTLVLGWPVRPKQSWLTQYRDVTADRIYDESVRGGAKRLKNLSFHLPKSLQFCKCLKTETYYGDWKSHVAEYDTVILIDEIRGRDVFEYILKKNPSCNLCVFID